MNTRYVNRYMNDAGRHRRAALLGLASFALAMPAAAGLAGITALPSGVAADAALLLALNQGRFCSATTQAQFQSCEYEKLDDLYIAKALCINISNGNERKECFDTAKVERQEGMQLCRDQKAERLEICGVLGEARYDPSFNPADFESDYNNLINPNPYFPLTPGHVWEYAGSLEVNTITALNETKLIEGVTCIVLNDKRYEDGLLAEDTDDWYGQRKNGTVDFCGEAVSNFETFPGDNPVRPERVSTDGQWKTGRDGDPSGTFILG